MPKPRGRPRLSAPEQKSRPVCIRFRPTDYVKVERAADRADVKISEWLRRAALKAAR